MTDGNVQVRAVHIDYAGADGFAKPMILAVAARENRAARDYELQAEEVFNEAFPEWRLRSCHAADGDLSVAAETLEPFFEHSDIWLMTKAD